MGEGQTGYNKTSREGRLNRDVEKALAEHYVCVYLDISQDGAYQLARQFEITRGRGIVISDKFGRHQAYHHDGDLAAGDLLQSLQRFSDPDLVVRTTQSNAVQVPMRRHARFRFCRPKLLTLTSFDTGSVSSNWFVDSWRQAASLRAPLEFAGQAVCAMSSPDISSFLELCSNRDCTSSTG